MKSSVIFAVGTFLPAICAGVALAQPPFRALHLSAFDKSGQAVTDLTAADLQISDDGKAQQVLFLQLNDDRPSKAPTVAAHEYSNQAGMHAGAVIILFDLLNGTFTDRNFIVSTILQSLQRVEDPANAFLYILTNKGTLYPVHGLPKKPGEAQGEENWTAQAKTLIDAAIQNVYGLRPVDEQMEGNREIIAYRMLKQLAAQTMVLPGRKTIVWTSQGFPMQIDLGGHCQDLMVEGVKAPCSGNFVDFTPPVRRLAESLDAAGVTIDPVDESESAARVMARDMFDVMAGLTGGKTYPRGGTPAAVAAATVSGRLGYTVGYEPAAKNWNGKFHKVKVTCARKDVQVLAEDGYIADPPVDQTTSLVQTAATRQNDLAQIGISAIPAPGATPNTLQLKVRIGPMGLLLVPKEDRFTGNLGFVMVGITDKGPVELGKPSQMNINLTKAQYDTSMRGGLSTTENVPVTDAVHQVRVVVVDRWTNRVGTLTVPVSR